MGVVVTYSKVNMRYWSLFYRKTDESEMFPIEITRGITVKVMKIYAGQLEMVTTCVPTLVCLFEKTEVYLLSEVTAGCRYTPDQIWR